MTGGQRPVIVLYSASPRRSELLERAGLPFTVRPVDADETIPAGLDSTEVVRAIAARKLEAGLALRHPGDSGWGLAADTLVEGPEGLLGKPLNESEALEMIRSLSGKVHAVHTGFAVHAPSDAPSPGIRTGVHTTRILFRSLPDEDIRAYIATGEWKGAAGAYRIQEKGELLVERIDGLWSTVVGLPLGPLCGILSAMSYPPG